MSSWKDVVDMLNLLPCTDPGSEVGWQLQNGLKHDVLFPMSGTGDDVVGECS